MREIEVMKKTILNLMDGISFKRRMQKLFLIIFVGVFASAAYARPNFETKKIKIKNQVITVEIADNEEKQEHGLMYKNSMPQNQGMLFVFNNEEIRVFWMKNTFLDLAIGYFNADKELIDIQEMKAASSVMQKDFPNYPSKSPAMYALEMNRGWFAKNKIGVGQKFEFMK